MARSGVMAAAIVAAVVVGAPASGAGTSPSDQKVIATLEQQDKRLTEGARHLKGGPQQELLLRRAKLRSIIERLERGEHVEPHELDLLLGR